MKAENLYEKDAHGDYLGQHGVSPNWVLPRIDKSKQAFYNTLNVSEGIRNSINIYNYLKNL